MSQTTPAPALPVDGSSLPSLVQVLGHLAAAAFVAAVMVVSAEIMTFTPAADAECLPEICGPAQNR